jgi:hypothetical protein
MSATEIEAEGQAPGEHLLAELKWVHGRIRHDLRICTELARDVAGGAAPELIAERVEQLKARGPLFQLRLNCLHYCRFVHMHHRGEDVHLFPALRASDPALGPTVDKLEADHREVGVRLGEIEASVAALVESDDEAARRRVVAALEAISVLLLAHLEFEEEAVGPTMLGWSQWPF